MNVSIENQTFDPPYDQQDGDKHLHVARGWRAWWSLEDAADSHGGNHHRPEYYQKRYGDPQKPLSCQAWQTTHATHRAGIYQVVDLPAGTRSLEAQAQVRYYAQDEEGRLGELALRLGLLPGGPSQGSGCDGMDPGIQWGPWRGQTDKTGWDGTTWETLGVELSNACLGRQAAGIQRATLFLESRCRWPVRNNHAFVNLVQMTAFVDEQPGPGPGGGDVLALLVDIRDLVREIYGFLEAGK